MSAGASECKRPTWQIQMKWQCSLAQPWLGERTASILHPSLMLGSSTASTNRREGDILETKMARNPDAIGFGSREEGMIVALNF